MTDIIRLYGIKRKDGTIDHNPIMINDLPFEADHEEYLACVEVVVVEKGELERQYELGRDRGFKDGESFGKDEGYDEGYRDGNTDGEARGYDIGFAEGRRAGYDG